MFNPPFPQFIHKPSHTLPPSSPRNSTQIQSMGMTSPETSSAAGSHLRTRRAFVLSNYLLIGAASSSAFLLLSLRLLPSVVGLLLLLLHSLTAASSVFACTLHSASSGRAHGAHMAATVLSSIFHGAVAVLIFTRPYEFLIAGLRSYVRAEDGVVILRMVGGLGVLTFLLEWVVLVLAFVLRYFEFVEGDGGGPRRAAAADVRTEGGEEMKDWPWPFQV